MMKAIRILFVEDDPLMCATYTENFSDEDFEVQSARDGQEALKIMVEAASGYDVVVTDSNMPNMDGLELMRKIHQSFPEVKVIVVTGYGDWTRPIDSHTPGLHKVLDKPVKMSDLKKLIRDMVDEKLENQHGPHT